MNISHFFFVNTKVGIETVASFLNSGKHLIVVLQLLMFLIGNSCKTNCGSKKNVVNVIMLVNQHRWRQTLRFVGVVWSLGSSHSILSIFECYSHT